MEGESKDNGGERSFRNKKYTCDHKKLLYYINGNIVAAMVFQHYSIFIKNGRAVTYIFTMQGVYIIESNKNGAAFYELSLGRYDSDRDYLRDGDRASGGSIRGGDSVFEGGSKSVRSDGWGYGTLGGDDADCREVRTSGGDGAENAAGAELLFPEIPGNHPSRKSIATNLLANILGLGWAATPAGLKAMEELSDLEEERRRKNSGR